ncbi:hypothetical protein ACYATL_06550 [Actinotignum timonense]|uniref:hypothetical protein n=1 Tax=Actinotignum TaxID=1653174 RepID=UPI002550A2C0|nr:hypothetical protein [Actinotignum timonense]MDK6906642.1 hypothetical protein [Actinotignum timonense]MDY5138329.1 hypothetical protein [Actinotignum timonense]
MRRFSTILVSCAVIITSLAGCSSNEVKDAAPTPSNKTTTQIKTPSPTPSPTKTTPKPVKHHVGDTLKNGAVKLTLLEVSETDHLEIVDGMNKAGTRQPDAGGKFFLAKAKVENVGKTSMDLTCSLPVKIKAFSAKSQEFDQVDELYKIAGNPECNDLMQPGFAKEITYAFMVPSDAEIIGVFFTDPWGDERDNPGIFTLNDNYTLSFG